AIPRPARSTPFPYTTLFRSLVLRDDPDQLPVFQQFVPVIGGGIRDGFFRKLNGMKKNGGSPPVDVRVRRVFDFLSFVEQVYMARSEEHTSELQSRENLVCRL